MQIESIKFRKDTIAALTIKSKPYYIKDADTPHLRLRIYPSGIKTFLICRKVKRKPQRIKIGRFGNLTIDQARQEAKRINSLIDLGHNPHSEKRHERNEITFKEVFQIYYKEHALPHTKDPELNRKALEYHVFPKFGNKRLSEITPENLRKFHTELNNGRAGSTANRVINMMSAVFNFAIKTPHYKGANPCSAVKRFRVKSRDRFLHPHELELFSRLLRRKIRYLKTFS
ncbi:MAG: integrase arm-type DNA-binding domain-containing protein [Bacteroidota bacterium]